MKRFLARLAARVRRWLGVPTAAELHRVRLVVLQIEVLVLLRARAAELRELAALGDREAPADLQVIERDFGRLLRGFVEVPR